MNLIKGNPYVSAFAGACLQSILFSSILITPLLTWRALVLVSSGLLATMTNRDTEISHPE